MGFVDKFLANKPEDKFFNLKRKEDISTIYHDEYKEHHEDLDYWCGVPVGFPVDCDKILGIFGQVGLLRWRVLNLTTSGHSNLLKRISKDYLIYWYNLVMSLIKNILKKI